AAGSQQPVAGPSSPRSQPATPASAAGAASVVSSVRRNDPSWIRTVAGRGITPRLPVRPTLDPGRLSLRTAPAEDDVAHTMGMPTLFDVIVRGGLMLDGAGSPAIPADVGIRAGRIVAIGGL